MTVHSSNSSSSNYQHLAFTPKPLPASATPIIDLALPDGPASATEVADPFCSRLGGVPALLHPVGTETETEAEAEQFYRCRVCGTKMFLIVQMDCPREDWPGIDRVVYVFGCNRRVCSQQPGGWKVLVQCRLNAEAASVQSAASASSQAATFWDDLMSADGNSSAKEMQISSTATAKTTPTTKATTTSTPTPTLPHFPPIFLHIEEELIMEKRSSNKSSSKSFASASTSTSTSEASTTTEEWAGEQYEKFCVPGADASFTRFQKRVAHYPRQCVRYTVAAPDPDPRAKLPPLQPPTALPFRDCQWAEELAALPICRGGCGSRLCRFELQLMPAVLAFLPTEQDAYLTHVKPAERSTNPLISDGMEWGTVMIFTCPICGPMLQSEAAVLIQVE